MTSRIRILASLLALLAGLCPSLSAAQPTQVVEDPEFGIRFLIPASWTWEPKSNGPVVSCEPSRKGSPVCYLAVEMRKAAANETVITPASRQKWIGWASANGPLASTNDAKIAGYPALETLSRSPSDTVYRAFVLMDSPPRVIDLTFYGLREGAEDYYSRHRKAMEAAIASLTAAGKPRR